MLGCRNRQNECAVVECKSFSGRNVADVGGLGGSKAGWLAVAGVHGGWNKFK